MTHHFGERIFRGKMSRRDFLWLMTASTASAAVTGCAVNPVSGEQQLILLSRSQEIAIDQEQSPHQFSSDYGASQDTQLNAYLSQVGQSLAKVSHRPDMPYSFRAVNATYVNAYAFPGGSIAATRGILLELDNEAELAGLLGHEIGHVNARHAAQQMSKGLLTQLVLGGTVAAAASSERYQGYANLLQTLGGIGAGALLAHYSRDNEREADALGMEYAARAGQNPAGMVGLMEVLVEQSKHKPNALELMFATHPMSSERYKTAKERSESQYAALTGVDLRRERYMDHTANLRRQKEGILKLQKADGELKKEEFQQAESHLKEALRIMPDDYAGLVMMSKCQLGLNNKTAAKRYADKAKEVYPSEAQAHHIAGIASLAMNEPQAALEDLNTYERLLPGNPNTVFLKGVAQERMQNRQAAAREYARYLGMVRQGGQAQHAYQQLLNWGYVKPREKKN